MAVSPSWWVPLIQLKKKENSSKRYLEMIPYNCEISHKQITFNMLVKVSIESFDINLYDNPSNEGIDNTIQLSSKLYITLAKP